MVNRFLIPRPRKLLNMVSAGVQATQLTDELRSVVDLYPFGLPRKIKRPASGVSRSKNFFLEFQDGRRVLKRYKSTMTPEVIAYEHSVLHLQNPTCAGRAFRTSFLAPVLDGRRPLARR